VEHGISTPPRSVERFHHPKQFHITPSWRRATPRDRDRATESDNRQTSHPNPHRASPSGELHGRTHPSLGRLLHKVRSASSIHKQTTRHYLSNGTLSSQRGAPTRDQPNRRHQRAAQHTGTSTPTPTPITYLATLWISCLQPLTILQVLSNIRNLTASLFGVAAGTLGLESYTGFIFYILASLVVSILLFVLKTEGKPGKFFYRPLGDLWLGDVFGGLSGFVLTWTLFYGLVRA
jgi:hypothetical protein